MYYFIMFICVLPTLHEKYSLLTTLLKCALNIALKLTFRAFLVFLCVLTAFQAS